MHFMFISEIQNILHITTHIFVVLREVILYTRCTRKVVQKEISRDFEDVMFNGGNTCGATEKIFNAHLRSDTLLQRPDLKE